MLPEVLEVEKIVAGGALLVEEVLRAELADTKLLLLDVGVIIVLPVDDVRIVLEAVLRDELVLLVELEMPRVDAEVAGPEVVCAIL